MASLLKRSIFSSLPHHRAAEGLPLQSRRQIHVEPGVREKALMELERNPSGMQKSSRFWHEKVNPFDSSLLAKDPALERFKSYRKSASHIRRVGDYLTIAVVAGCCYEIYVRAVTREEARKALKLK